MRLPVRKTGKERGAILPLFAIMALPLLILVSVVIDVGIFFASRQQALAFTRVSALAALQEFYDTNDCLGIPCTNQQRYDAALARAQQIGSRQKLIGSPHSVPQIGEFYDAGKARLIPGRWSTDTGECPSSDGCFVETADLSDPAESINSFRMEGKLYNSITNQFAAALLGFPVLPIHVFTTATVVPRHACFVVDISPSITRETHRQRPTAPDMDEAAYLLPQHNPGISSTYDEAQWNWLESNYPNRPPEEIPTSSATLHFADDYRQKITFGGGYDREELRSRVPDFDDLHPENSGIYELPDRHSYEVDVYTDANYEGPNPLTDIFSSLNQIMNLFEQRAVTGDRACLVFYNASLAWPRVVRLTNNWPYLKGYTDYTVYGSISDDPALPSGPIDPAQAAVDPDPKDSSNLFSPAFTANDYYDTQGRELAIRRGLFPTYNSFSDMYLGVTEALSQLESAFDEESVSSDFIVHFGDGLANVYREGGSRYMGGGYDEHQKAITEFGNFMLTHAGKTNPVPIHFILFGDDVGPHTVEHQKPGAPFGTCMSDDEFRSSRSTHPFDFVKGDDDPQQAYQNRDAANPYFTANRKLYEFSVRTRGIFQPIRPPASGCSPGERIACTPGDRMLLDPFCRTPEQQIDDALMKIMGENPFTISEIGSHYAGS